MKRPRAADTARMPNPANLAQRLRRGRDELLLLVQQYEDALDRIEGEPGQLSDCQRPEGER